MRCTLSVENVAVETLFAPVAILRPGRTIESAIAWTAGSSRREWLEPRVDDASRRRRFAPTQQFVPDQTQSQVAALGAAAPCQVGRFCTCRRSL
jgi:hypothetical protein